MHKTRKFILVTNKLTHLYETNFYVLTSVHQLILPLRLQDMYYMVQIVAVYSIIDLRKSFHDK